MPLLVAVKALRPLVLLPALRRMLHESIAMYREGSPVRTPEAGCSGDRSRLPRRWAGLTLQRAVVPLLVGYSRKQADSSASWVDVFFVAGRSGAVFGQMPKGLMASESDPSAWFKSNWMLQQGSRPATEQKGRWKASHLCCCELDLDLC